MQSVRDKQTVRNLADKMAGVFEHNRARPGKPILIGTVTAEAMDRWRNKSCEVCETITNTCRNFWDHLQNAHDITSNNVATFHKYVQYLINTALGPNSEHFIVTLVKCAQILNIIEINGTPAVGDDEIIIIQHLDPFGSKIVNQATSDPFYQAILKKVSLCFLAKYGALIHKNWNLTKKVKMEIKQEIVDQEPEDQLKDKITLNEHNLESEDVKKESVESVKLPGGKLLLIESDKLPRTKATDEAIASESTAYKGTSTPDEILLAEIALAGSAQHRYLLTQKQGWLNHVRVALNMMKRRMQRRLIKRYTKTVIRLQQAHHRSKVVDVNKKEEENASDEIKNKPVDAINA